MNKIRFKQRKMFKLMKAVVIFAAVFIFIFIGAKPIIAEYNQTIATVLNYFCDVLVIAILIILFMYYSKYGKCDAFLSHIENEINDNGYYLTSRNEKDIDSYIDAMLDDLKQCGYSVNKNITISDFDFSIKAVKRKEFFYAAAIDGVDKNDILAYLDSVIQDVTVRMVRKKGDVVLCFVTDKAEDDAIALSKMITPLGKKEQLKIALAICETETGNVYFLGNEQTKSQQMIANFVMNCDVPIKEKYIHRDKLKFQYELENKMEDFTIKDFENGTFYAH